MASFPPDSRLAISSRKTLFITGVSSGLGNALGNALAWEALAAGHRVIGTALVSYRLGEFKRLFGRTPQAEIERMKATYALPAPVGPPVYVSSH